LHGIQPSLFVFRTHLDVAEAFPIDPWRATVAGHSLKRVLQSFPPAYLPIEAVEAPLRFGLGFAVERNLELPKLSRG
jgi:hypothetical protein